MEKQLRPRVSSSGLGNPLNCLLNLASAFLLGPPVGLSASRVIDWKGQKALAQNTLSTVGNLNGTRTLFIGMDLNIDDLHAARRNVTHE